MTASRLVLATQEPCNATGHTTSLLPVPRRPRLLVLNQYYWPGVEATAYLLAELCEALAEDYEITVVTGRVRGLPQLPSRELRNGVEIVRVRSSAYDRARLSRRAVNYVTYLARALRLGLALPRPDVVLCGTDPPVVGEVALAVARRHRAPLVVISEDVFPEIAVALHRLENRPLVTVLRLLVQSYLRRADRVVSIGEAMSRRLEEKGVAPERLRVIPNWADVSALRPQPKSNAWAEEHDLAGRFVVMHAGNVGHAQDLATLIRSTTFLRDLDLRVVIIGTGARHAELVGLAEVLEADQVRFLEFQPRERLPEALAAADVHVVGLARGLAGYVVPSRIYGILAAGRPVIAAAEEESETAQLVRAAGCGLVVPPGDPLALAEVIRACHDGSHPLEEMGRRAREYAEAEADRSVAVGRYRAVLGEVVDARG
jgi:glycosyltransferase involved in cell wall biosynthesis